MALGLVTYLLTGISLSTTDAVSSAITLVVIAAIFGIVNAIVKPLAQVFSGCLILLSFGLFLWVINAAMLMLTSWLAGQFGLGWHVADWSSAFLGSLILSVISLVTQQGTERR